MTAKGVVTINENKCKGCELCISVCPKDVIRISGHQINRKGYHPAYAENAHACIACTNCALICPDCAISVYKEEDKINNA